MASGVQIYSKYRTDTGNYGKQFVTLDTSISNGVFFKSTNSYTNSTAISTQYYATQSAIASPDAPLSGSYPYAPSYGWQGLVLNLNGQTDPTGTNFYQAGRFRTGGQLTTGSHTLNPTINAISTIVDVFGKPSPPTSGNGLFVYGDIASNVNNVAIDDTYSASFIQPPRHGMVGYGVPGSGIPQQTTGTYDQYRNAGPLRTAVAVSVPGSRYTYNSSWLASSIAPAQNVFFDQEFNTPPLMFITQTSSQNIGIALSHFVKNANGKFVGACVVAEGLWGQFPNTGGIIGVTGSYSITFEYFLVSQDTPAFNYPTFDDAVNDTNASYVDTNGMQVYGPSGNKIFDSTYHTPIFNYATFNSPYVYTSSPTSTTTQWNWQTINGSIGWYGGAYGIAHGVLLNNFRHVTGMTQYTYEIYLGGGYGVVTLYGQYICVSNDSSTGLTTFKIGGRPTVSFGTVAAPITSPYNRSDDFYYGNIPLNTVVLATMKPYSSLAPVV